MGVVSVNKLGRYQIIREIARSNDIVYEAVDTSINRRIALKELLMPPNVTGAQKRERVERFYREARAAGSLSHPNIVTIFEAGEENDRHFIAMEFLEGQTLRDVIEIEGKLSVDKAVEIVKQMCSALAYAHSKNVVHRDVKPDNIQILPGGQIKLTDFGIARIMEEPTLTADGQVFGTPSYMSPEQVAGKPLDRRTDIFSLGIVLYEMLAGAKPFTGDSVVTITYNIMNQDISIPPFIPNYIERVLRRCLAKDPDLRYSSVEEIVADLDNANADTPHMLSHDPFRTTTSIPRTVGMPQQPAPQTGFPSQSQHDPFQNVRPSQARPAPRKPMLSPESRYFLTVLTAVIAVSGLVVLFIWLISAGYQGYQNQLQSQEVVMHLEAGQRHLEQQSYSAAIEEFNYAMSISKDPEIRNIAKRNITNAYMQMGMQAERSGNSLQAITYYRQALSVDPSSADAHLLHGNALYHIRRDDEALSAWGLAIRYGHGSKTANTARQNAAVLYHHRGDEAYRSGNREAALQWWRRALDVAPGTEAGFKAQEKIDKFGG